MYVVFANGLTTKFGLMRPSMCERLTSVILFFFIHKNFNVKLSYSDAVAWIPTRPISYDFSLKVDD